MPDYSKGKIYTIRCHSNDKLIYVGCTTTSLSVRLAGHKRNVKISLYKYINNPENNTTWDDWYIELYENFPCNCKEELNKRENEVIRDLATINERGFYIDRKDYRKQNKDEIKAKIKEWREQNKDELLAKKKEYREQNKDIILAKAKEYHAQNRDKILAKHKEWREQNKDEIKAKKKEYRERKKKSLDIN
jgi:hypothetical protein